MQVGTRRFELIQFHFHHPSEEALDGKRSEMVAHLVHRGAQGRIAVVAVLLKSGPENPLVSTVWHNLPQAEGHERTPKGVSIDVTKLLPSVLDYYTYPGSLTTPPCTERVRWFVLKRPVMLSADQIATFRKLYPHNARPLHPLNGRAVLSSG